MPNGGYIKQSIDPDFGKIGKIDKTQILKYDKQDSIIAFIYKSSIYENKYFGEYGIWIGYSENRGKDWSYYYTGIVQRQPLYLKSYSQRPLIKEKGKLEIDACLLRQLSPFYHPGGSPYYECVKDGIYVTFDIDVISKDSDGDGLTDIVEDKFYTNKFNRDTDGDGIPDNIDSNPRKYYPKTEKTRIYEAYLDEKIDWNNEEGRGMLLLSDAINYVTDSTETILIVTDNEDLFGVSPQRYRIIFMAPDEYVKNKNRFETELNKMHISPLFRVDGKKDTYKMNDFFNTWGGSYLIRKAKNKWIIQRLSFVIS